MKAIVVQGEPSNPQLVWQDWAEPHYGVEEVLVRVRATAVNRADLMQAGGNYPPPPGVTEILGLEMAGEIVAIGSKVTNWQVGDRVCALLAGGGYAELAAVPASMLIRLPDEWSFEQGAAIPEVWLTAFVNLFHEGQLKAGEKVLIHAAASGVGTAAIQLAKATGAWVAATAGTDQKTVFCRQLGADLAINYKTQDFLHEIRQHTNSDGVDLILDPVGGAYLVRNVQLLRPFGRLINIGLLNGTRGELDMMALLRKRLRLIGSTLRNRTIAEKAALTQQFVEQFMPLFRAGILRPIIDVVYPIIDARAAHDYLHKNLNMGKLILIIT